MKKQARTALFFVVMSEARNRGIGRPQALASVVVKMKESHQETALQQAQKPTQSMPVRLLPRTMDFRDQRVGFLDYRLTN